MMYFIFTETVLKEHSNVTQVELEKTIMVWFHHAGDRWKRKLQGSTALTEKENNV
jgi:hypothetical protein